MTELKLCTKCKHEKPITEFYANSLYKDGYMNMCKECFKQYARNKRNTQNKNYWRQYYQNRKNKQQQQQLEKRQILDNTQQILTKLDQILEKLNVLSYHN